MSFAQCFPGPNEYLLYNILDRLVADYPVARLAYDADGKPFDDPEVYHDAEELGEEFKTYFEDEIEPQMPADAKLEELVADWYSQERFTHIITI